jgi:hypothetical protein
MKSVSVGNAAIEARPTKGWFVGQFITGDDLRKTSAVEVKWGVHPAGNRNAGGFVANQTATTVSVLIQGAFRLWFRDGDKVEQFDLDSPGKYALWLPGVAHNWLAVSDCVVLTVRWPSLPKDQSEEA